MTGPEVAVLITAVVGAGGGIIAAARSFQDSKVESVGTVVEAYKGIVATLQAEIVRLNNRITELETQRGGG